jgi:hypothetical protein
MRGPGILSPRDLRIKSPLILVISALLLAFQEIIEVLNLKNQIAPRADPHRGSAPCHHRSSWGVSGRKTSLPLLRLAYGVRRSYRMPREAQEN